MEREKNIRHLKNQIRNEVRGEELRRLLLDLYKDNREDMDIGDGEYRSYIIKARKMDSFLEKYELLNSDGFRWKTSELYDATGYPFYVWLRPTCYGVNFHIPMTVAAANREGDILRYLNAVNSMHGECSCHLVDDKIFSCYHITEHEDGQITEKEMLSGLVHCVDFYETVSQGVRMLLQGVSPEAIMDDLFGLPW